MLRVTRAFAKSYYSAPHPLIGQHVRVRAAGRAAQLFHDHGLVATHGRALRPGQRVTNSAHLPPQKLPGQYASRRRMDRAVPSFGVAPSFTGAAARIRVAPNVARAAFRPP